MMKSEKKNIWVFFNEILDIYNIDMQNSVKQQIYTKLNFMPPWGQNVTVKYSILLKITLERDAKINNVF